MTGQTKKDPLKRAGLGDLLLFCVFHGAGLTHNVDLDLTGVVELVFDLLGQVAGRIRTDGNRAALYRMDDGLIIREIDIPRPFRCGY